MNSEKYFIIGINPSYHTPEEIVVYTSKSVSSMEEAKQLLKSTCDEYAETLIDFCIVKTV